MEYHKTIKSKDVSMFASPMTVIFIPEILPKSKKLSQMF